MGKGRPSMSNKGDGPHGWHVDHAMASIVQGSGVVLSAFPDHMKPGPSGQRPWCMHSEHLGEMLADYEPIMQKRGREEAEDRREKGIVVLRWPVCWGMCPRGVIPHAASG